MSHTCTKVGIEEGDTCARDPGHCMGVIEIEKPENCSCDISAPCSACTSCRHHCPVCGWREEDDVCANDHIVNLDRDTGTYRAWSYRPLQPGTFDWHSLEHTHFSMVKRGVYPPDMTREQVEAKVRGTFGGRFNYFGNGEFEYVAYTD